MNFIYFQSNKLVTIIFFILSLPKGELANVRPVSGYNIYEINHPSLTSNCEFGQTTVNGKRACKGILIFQDYFSNGINTSIWSHDILFADIPDYEFVIYDDGQETSFIETPPTLSIKPTIQPKSYLRSRVNLGSKCTGTIPQECSRRGNAWNILPPIKSSRITTKNSFSFKYGIIEIQARLPEGDWIVPQIRLMPKNQEFGKNEHFSGQIRIAQTRGNNHLLYNGDDIGNTQLESGLILGLPDHFIRLMHSKKTSKDPWTKQFHSYELEWTPDIFQFRVDNNIITTIYSPRGGWANLPEFRNISNQLRDVPESSPFDQEFYLAFGVGVGGFSDFPESLPWVQNRIKAALVFIDDQGNWERTWNENSQLLIKKIRIWSI